jgi:DNA-binding transcriptional ArsR family regulator
LYQPLTTLTKAVAVALDIAGRPDTDDAYALNSVRKAYSLLNGGTFQDLVGRAESTPQSIDYGIDWAGVYRLEAEKTHALTSQLEELRAELLAMQTSTQLPEPQPWGAQIRGAEVERRPSQRIERSQAQILAALSESERTVHELSRLTNIHSRTVQRRLRELMAAGMVKQATDGITPTYMLAGKGT